MLPIGILPHVAALALVLGVVVARRELVGEGAAAQEKVGSIDARENLAFHQPLT